MGLLGSIVGRVAKNIFPKNTIAGKLLGSTRPRGSKPASTAYEIATKPYKKPIEPKTEKLVKNASVETSEVVKIAGVEMPAFVVKYWPIGAVIIGGAILYKIFAPKPKKRR